MSGNLAPFVILDSVDSTNNYAMGMVKKGVWSHKQAVLARYQTAGKGQMGKSWSSNENVNILVSFVVDARFLGISSQFALSIAAALACVELLEQHVSNVKIKWPNDIYIGDRKAGGILIETIIQGNELKSAVIGIGINVNETGFDDALSNAISLKQINGKEYDVIEMATLLYEIFYKKIDRLKSEEQPVMQEEYNQRLYKRFEKGLMKANAPDIRAVKVTRYVTPLREGGSLPAIAEADDGFLYVLKFRGAGQGSKALIADLIGGEIARAIGLKVPEIVFADLDAAFGRTEPDEEIQDLLRASVGLNLGLHYLSGAITYDPSVKRSDELIASKIVWMDAFLMNVDRTARNTNMLSWHNELWLIDHGAALYFHHSGTNWEEQSLKPFVQIKDHVLLRQASELSKADEALRLILTDEKIRSIVSIIPDDWLNQNGDSVNADEMREVYNHFLMSRRNNSEIFVKEAIHARG